MRHQDKPVPRPFVAVRDPANTVVREAHAAIARRRDLAEMAGLRDLADQLTSQLIELARLTNPSRGDTRP